MIQTEGNDKIMVNTNPMKSGLIALMLALTPLSASAFTVERIQFEGLQRVRPETVRTYLSIKEGGEVESKDTRRLVEELYKTGFLMTLTYLALMVR